MNIISEFRSICESLETPLHFILADLDKGSKITDALKRVNYPCMLFLPTPVKDNQTSGGLITSSMQFDAFILDRHDQKTIDFKHEEVEEKIVVPMRKLARQFVKKLNTQSFMYETNSIREVEYRPTYSSMDSKLHGVEVSFSFTFIEPISICG